MSRIRPNITEKEIKTVERAIQAIDRNELENSEQLKANRECIFRIMIEQFSMWNEEFDCLPSLIQIGRFNPKYIRFAEVNAKGKLIKLI